MAAMQRFKSTQSNIMDHTPAPQHQPEQGIFDRFNRWLSESVTIRLLSVGFLILILMIPNAMVNDLINERRSTSEEAMNEVSASWAEEQTIIGPFVSVPYDETTTDEHGKQTTVRGHYHLMPSDLEVSTTLTPSERSRGIYKVVVYESKSDISAAFTIPDLSTEPGAKLHFVPSEARLCMGIPDMRGISERLVFNANGTELECGPGLPSSDIFTSGVSVVIPDSIVASHNDLKVALQLSLKGSRTLNFVPIGKETRVNIASPWTSPSFFGSFLPSVREINKDGFTASWKVFDLNRNFPQEWYDSEQDIHPSTFGVRLMRTVDHYTLSSRSGKYAILVIALTFVVYFFTESLSRRRIHPVQYILVGLALSVFFLLLLSLSEHIGFNLSFVLGAIATTALITFYSRGVFNDTRMALFMGGLLAVIYGFIFTILQLEDLALLVGSIGLFLVLAVIMIWSRRVNWYGLGSSEN
jgi:inner membrane protein